MFCLQRHAQSVLNGVSMRRTAFATEIQVYLIEHRKTSYLAYAVALVHWAAAGSYVTCELVMTVPKGRSMLEEERNFQPDV